MRLLAGLLAAAALLSASPPTIYYTKGFPGSSPSWVGIWVNQRGEGEYRESPEDDHPVRLALNPAETREIFSLVEKLGFFSRNLESGAKVAFLGAKTFRYTDGSRDHRVEFNHSEDADAQRLADWFERITETAIHFVNIERAAKYDHLGLDAALLQLQISADRKRLAGASILLPVLDRIARNRSAFNRVRERAAAIAETIRGGSARAE